VETKPFSDIAYEQFLAEEKLMGSRCKKCGAVFVPPRPICIKCYGDNIEWLEMRGSGKLCAFTCIAVGPPSMIEEGYTRDLKPSRSECLSRRSSCVAVKAVFGRLSWRLSQRRE